MSDLDTCKTMTCSGDILEGVIRYYFRMCSTICIIDQRKISRKAVNRDGNIADCVTGYIDCVDIVQGTIREKGKV